MIILKVINTGYQADGSGTFGVSYSNTQPIWHTNWVNGPNDGYYLAYQHKVYGGNAITTQSTILTKGTLSLSNYETNLLLQADISESKLLLKVKNETISTNNSTYSNKPIGIFISELYNFKLDYIFIKEYSPQEPTITFK